jgi:hypothetical protein
MATSKNQMVPDQLKLNYLLNPTDLVFPALAGDHPSGRDDFAPWPLKKKSGDPGNKNRNC